MRQFVIVLLIFSVSGCCGLFHKKETYEIKDKTWFPYKEKSSITYKTYSGLVDTLLIDQLDSADMVHGVECLDYEENRYCEILSSRFNNIQIQVRLSSTALVFDIVRENNLTHFYYCTTCKKPASNSNELEVIDSIYFNNIKFQDVLFLSDSAKNFEIFYNRQGILRYALDKDTFDLK